MIYLDDILILTQSQSIEKEHIAQVAELLSRLGFTINTKKSVLDPTQSMEFLGFVVRSTLMTLSLPQEKVAKTRKEYQHLKNHLRTTPRQLCPPDWSAHPAVDLAPLHYRALQRLRNKALIQGWGDSLI